MAAASSLTSCYQFKWFHSAMVLSLALICFISTVSCANHNILYADHCVSLVSKSTPRNPESTTIPFPSNQDGFFTGGREIFSNLPHGSNSLNGRRSLLFLTHNVYTTDFDDIYKVQASLIFQQVGMSYYAEDVAYSFSYSPQVVMDGSHGGPVEFAVKGFWSKSNGKLCMIGSSTVKSPEGKTRVFTGVLKLYDITSSNTITSSVKGTLDSLSSVGDVNYFEPVSLLMFPKMNYNYAKGLFGLCSGGIHDQRSKLLNLALSTPICSIFLGDFTLFELEKDSSCSMRNCSLSVETGRSFRRVMSLRLIQCSTDKRSMRFLLEFPDKSYVRYNDPFLPSATLVAEGSWDAKRSQFCGIACRISNATESLNASHIEDCSTRLSFRFPSVWSIGKSNAIVGEIWSLKTIQDPGYFNKITFKSFPIEMEGIPGLIYKYTLLDKSKSLCQKRQPNQNISRVYPDVNSEELRFFDISVRISRGLRIGWGNIEPVFVGDKPRSLKMPQILGTPEIIGTSSINGRSGNKGQLNLSYRISLPNIDKAQKATVQIFAEGIYDSETGETCMAGCKYLDGNNQMLAENVSMDCEISVKLEFPPYDSKERIQGRVESKRDISDPLYFQSLTFSAVSAYRSRFGDSIRRMDSEIIMVLISNTLVCAIASYQTYYVKKNPGISSFISLLMLAILSLGHMIPLIANFEASSLADQNNPIFPRRSGGRLEINKFFVRVLSVVAFLFQLRLLQNVWSARFAKANQMAAWSAEKKTVFTCFPLYITGAIIALAMNSKNYKSSENQGQYVNDHKTFPWTELWSYSGLVMDGFLLPQIMLNIFQNSNKVALSQVFYMGTTLIRLLPHAYDLYRAHYCNDDLDWSYAYANFGIDYYSTSWDIIIPSGCLFFAAILHMQQRFCGRFFLPKKFKMQQGHKNLQLTLGSHP